MNYAQLQCTTNFSFLKGGSHPYEYLERACELGYKAIAITDECSLAGIVKAYVASKSLDIKLLVGSHIHLSNGAKIIVLAPTRQAYAELSGFISLARTRATKGEYRAHFEDLRFRLQNCILIWLAEHQLSNIDQLAAEFALAFKQRLWIGIDHQLGTGEQKRFAKWHSISLAYNIPMIACGSAVMHVKTRKPLFDTLTAIRENTSLEALGTRVHINAECYLKSLPEIAQLYSQTLIDETIKVADLCSFSMSDLRYQYPQELVPKNKTPIQYLRDEVAAGAAKRWPKGIKENISKLLEKELSLIEELQYEFFFLTVYDIVLFAKSRNILCQGRGSAANSVVCYCLHITEISPDNINVLFERFISKERDEPPDIDVDFEHRRREEVIQYIYQKYGRERAAIAATVVSYRARSAIRDVGKALSLDAALIDHLAKSLAWWDRQNDLIKRIEESGLHSERGILQLFFSLVDQILGFPRHLSQHVGGFIIAQDRVSDLVPLENASMPGRTVIQWDKDDLESMHLLKVDILALGMLTALKKCIHYVQQYDPSIANISDIPEEDEATYAMLSKGDSVGVFQVESRAQISMLPRLKPKTYYDLVIQIAIVRPGPIQGDMVHPYLMRRGGKEDISYVSEELEQVLKPTLGVPIFQEQAIRLAMVAAGFSGGEADQLRRAMASWGKNGNLLRFQEKFISGMLAKGYEEDFAHRMFAQIKGFGGYGFPESHSASFALLCYFSSWFKCHHPAAFYCALLNSQPMGFYTPSQLIQDARRHRIKVLPIDVNHSDVECSLEKRPSMSGEKAQHWCLRLGMLHIRSLEAAKAELIVKARAEQKFSSLHDLVERTKIGQATIKLLAAADALHSISAHRYDAHWQASAIDHSSVDLLNRGETNTKVDRTAYDKQQENPLPESDKLTAAAPSLEKNISLDLSTSGVSLRPHPMTILRAEKPFSNCTKQDQLIHISNGRFVRVAGIVTGRQRPGTAKGTLFLTLEDETGNINVIVWKQTQETFRKTLLTATLLVIKGRLEKKHEVCHVIAGELEDYSERLKDFAVSSRNFH